VQRDLVSAIIPTYNRADLLHVAVGSVLGQTHRQVEAVVVDDGSTDGTVDVVSRLWANEPRVRYLGKSNGGVSSARNAGLREARGDFVAFLDSDDAWLPWKIELQLACLRAFPRAGMIWSDMRALNPDGTFRSGRHLRTMYSAWRRFDAARIFGESRRLADLVPGLAPHVNDDRVYVGDIFPPMLTGSLVHTSTVLLTRERLERVGRFDEALRPSGEDYDFHLRTCGEGPVAFADLPTIDYRVGLADQLTRPEYRIHIARHFLVALERGIAAHRDRIDLPPGVLEEVLGEAHRWIGMVSLDDGDHAQARRHLVASLRHRPLQPDTALRLCLALLPPALAARLRRMVRSARTAIGAR
jgi:glycosyltransferase involved in cell wall biosynthesis